MGQDLVHEDRRLRGHTGHVARVRTEKPRDRLVHEPGVVLGLRTRHERVQLGVEPREEVGVEQVLHDHRAVLGECVDDAYDGIGRRDPGQVGHSDSVARRGGATPGRGAA